MDEVNAAIQYEAANRNFQQAQRDRADFLLLRKDAYYALLVRVALCRELFAQLPADLQADISAVVGDLIQ